MNHVATYNIKSHKSARDLISLFSLPPPTVSFCSGTDNGRGVLRLGVPQQALHWDAYSPGKAAWAGLALMVSLCYCVLDTVYVYEHLLCNYISHQFNDLMITLGCMLNNTNDILR